MSEREPTLPHATMSIRDWCDERGIDSYQYDNLSWRDIRVAPLRSQELSVAEKLRQEIESSLPLENCELVDDPRLIPGQESLGSKMYLASKGMAFELTTTYEYEQLDDWDDPIEGAPKKTTTRTFIGEYLGIETRVVGGTPKGDITVRERPTFYAVPSIKGSGSWEDFEEQAIRLPSKYDPTKDGAYVYFDRIDGWQVVYSGGSKLEGRYGESSVRLVPHEKATVDELYVANLSQYVEFALDDFRFYDERPELPAGFFHLPIRHSEEFELVHNEVLKLILPPLEGKTWDELWYQHHIMIKFNPTVREPRSFFINFGARFGAGFDIRKLNTLSAEDRLFQRVLVAQNVGTMTMDEVVRAITSPEKFSEEEYKQYIH